MALLCKKSGLAVHDGICFHCQQCAEKYLKGLLQELGISFPRTHDLEALQAQLLPHYSTLKSVGRGLAFLNDFAVEGRYPGKRVSKRQAAAALRWADIVRTVARAVLGLRAKP